ncbi:hypothetical protein L596_026495 [Steinernema carpocapsae]|uniref:Uncharacterized protein n=1 Tax=Steinernema carpocapsae TaxID=34508 RepID=A0A4U5M1L6_STECR|nr:hypothetical protein L596_026495 [Steinernema carpocapsae]
MTEREHREKCFEKWVDDKNATGDASNDLFNAGVSESSRSASESASEIAELAKGRVKEGDEEEGGKQLREHVG